MSDAKPQWKAHKLVLASDYDALAQRCRELEADLAEQADLLKETSKQRDFLDRLQSDECFRREKAEAERDALARRCRELESSLQKAAFKQQADESAYSVVVQQNDALRAEVEGLRQFVDFVRHAPVSSGVCCCGDNMANHPEPMNCGHSPVDEWDHALLGWLKELGVEQ